MINKLIPYRVEIGGLILFVLAVVTLLALLGVTNSGWLAWWTSLLRQTFGWGAYALCVIAAVGGLHVALRKVERPYRVRPAQVIGLELLLLTALPLSHLLTNAELADVYQGKAGGLVGWALAEPLLDFLGPLLTGLFYVGIFVWGFALLVGFRWEDLRRTLHGLSQRLRVWSLRVAPAARPATPVQERPQPSPPAPQPTPPPRRLHAQPPLVQQASPALAPPTKRDRRLPPYSLLDKGRDSSLSDSEIQKKKQVIEHTLADFGIPAAVTQIRHGPAVTQYGVQPGYIERTGANGEVKQHKVRVGQIASLRRDLALALAVPRLRIQAPVPGRGVVGVEVPNDRVSLVRLRDVVESTAFKLVAAPLAVGLGRDVSGAPLAIDLAKMPHLLIAGTTGSGKSACINAFVSCLVFNNRPDQLELIMIDPKKVELARFNGLPHLIGHVETEADRAVGVLRWLTAEMDRRYEIFSQVNARNLEVYNRKVARGKVPDETRPLPYMAVFIDELADLMHTYPGDVERTLCRLAQMARATGIHLIVATQRPSTDVITGLIKANFPARLSFAVASSTDSRVILDTTGADQLLGKGDMLFLGPDASGPVRVQGVFVTDDEIERITTYWRNTLPDHDPTEPPWETLIAKYALLDETDPLLEQAIELTQKHDTISTSFLQRRLHLGYPRAARIMEHLYDMGIVEDPKSGGKTRKTLVDEDDDPFEQLLSE